MAAGVLPAVQMAEATAQAVVTTTAQAATDQMDPAVAITILAVAQVATTAQVQTDLAVQAAEVVCSNDVAAQDQAEAGVLAEAVANSV